MVRIDDMMLMAYVDGEVDPETAREIEAAVAAEPGLGRRIAQFRETSAATRAAYGDVLAEPVPERLTQLFSAAAGAQRQPQAAAVAVLSPAAGRRAGFIWRNAGWAAAAAIAAVALIFEGGRIGLPPFASHHIQDVAASTADSERWIDNLAAWYRVHHASFEKDQRLLVDIGAENLEELEKWVGTKLQREITVPDLSAFGFRSQGGRLLLIGRRPAAQFFYAGESQELVQLVIGFTDQPDRSGRLDQRDDVNIISWRDKGYAYAFIGRIDGQRLWRMADASWVKLKPA
jgi:anti-sigma factor RsiW